MDVKIVLVTGSRDWTDQDAVFAALQEHLGSELVGILRHGHCPTGADHYADVWGNHQPGIAVDRMPADWSRGKSAGPRRNKAMVTLPVSLVLAFPLGVSRGTRGCMAMANERRILVINYGEE